MNSIPLNLVFEDQISEFVMVRLAEKANKYFISNSYSEGGFGYIKKTSVVLMKLPKVVHFLY